MKKSILALTFICSLMICALLAGSALAGELANKLNGTWDMDLDKMLTIQYPDMSKEEKDAAKQAMTQGETNIQMQMIFDFPKNEVALSMGGTKETQKVTEVVEEGKIVTIAVEGETDKMKIEIVDDENILIMSPDGTESLTFKKVK